MWTNDKCRLLLQMRIALAGLLAIIALHAPVPLLALDFKAHPKAAELVDQIAQNHGLDRSWVRAIISDAEFNQEIIDLITRPAEKFPWYRYRKLFVTEANAKAGVKFWMRYRDILSRAESQFGVDAQVIVAIIGVETRYGRVTGRHRVIDSLSTLALGYPRRSEFFAKELGEFLKLSSEEGLNPYRTKGSYAGAIGIPQFIASSYSHYAVDFNGNGKRDLLREPDDAIGSVANYLKQHGWELGGEVFVDLEVGEGADLSVHETSGLSTSTTFGALREAGALLPPDVQIDADQALGLVVLDATDSQRIYRGSFPNFYVITTYNRSALYASAVAELAQMINRFYRSQ